MNLNSEGIATGKRSEFETLAGQEASTDGYSLL